MISADTVTAVVERMASTSHTDVPLIVNRMTREQPFILAYLLAMSEAATLTRDEGQTLFYIGAVVWQIMNQHPGGCRKVSKRELDKAIKDNEDFLEKLSADSPGDFASAAMLMVENYPEPEVLRYVVEAIMEEEDGESVISEESLGGVFLHLKIVLDALIGSTKAGR